MENTSVADMSSLFSQALPTFNTLLPYVPGAYHGGDSSAYGDSIFNTTTMSSMLSYNYSDEDLNGTIPKELPDPKYYSQAYRVAGALFVSLIFLVGLGGNVMVVIVVARTRSMHTTTNCYLVSLAVADVLVLISATLPTIWELFIIIDQCVIGWLGCSIMVFLQYLGVNTSSLSITAFTVERYIAICHPMRAQTMCTVKRAKRIIFMLWTFGVAYSAPWLFLTTTHTREYKGGLFIEECTFKLERKSYLTYYMADLVIFYVFPLLLTCVLYGLIARILFDNSIPSTPGKANGVNSNSKKSSSVSSSRVQVIKMLAVVVGLFATLWMPYRIFVVYNSFATIRYTDLWFRLFCRIMVYMNSAINPILYNAMSVKFRRAFRRLLSCGRREEEIKLFLYSEVCSADRASTTRHGRYRLINGQNTAAVKPPPVSTSATASTTTTNVSTELHSSMHEHKAKTECSHV